MHLGLHRPLWDDLFTCALALAQASTCLHPPPQGSPLLNITGHRLSYTCLLWANNTTLRDVSPCESLPASQSLNRVVPANPSVISAQTTRIMQLTMVANRLAVETTFKFSRTLFSGKLISTSFVSVQISRVPG